MPTQLIACVDHDAIFLTLVRQLLEHEGYRALVWSGATRVQTMVVRRQPDLVILDIQDDDPAASMRMLALLRLDPVTEHLPILLCSADRHFLLTETAVLLAAGCETVAKPVTRATLLAKVSALIGPVRLPDYGVSDGA